MTDPLTASRGAIGPLRWFNSWTKKRGADRLALMREGSAAVTPLIELAKTVGPTGILWGDDQQVHERFVGWAEEWDRLRPALLTYANAHPSGKIKTQANELVPVFGASFGATRYLFVSRASATTMDAFNAATDRQEQAVAAAEKLMEAIRRY